MSIKLFLGAAAVGAGLTVGAVAGAAVTDDTGGPVSPEEVRDFGGPLGGRPGRVLHHVALDVAADTIGIAEDELFEALRDGQSIAQVAEANGVDPQAVVDALVAEANARLDEAVAEGDLDAEDADELRAGIAERIAEAVEREGLPGPGRGHGPLPGRPFVRAGLDTAAEAIGIEVEDLAEALRDGQTVAEVAEANGVDPQAVIDALVAEAEEHIANFVLGE